MIRHHRSKISFQIFPICLAILHYCIIENYENLNAEICYKRIRENHPNSFINVELFLLVIHFVFKCSLAVSIRQNRNNSSFLDRQQNTVFRKFLLN